VSLAGRLSRGSAVSGPRPGTAEGRFAAGAVGRLGGNDASVIGGPPSKFMIGPPTPKRLQPLGSHFEQFSCLDFGVALAS
jgi:hypothetical protein